MSQSVVFDKKPRCRVPDSVYMALTDGRRKRTGVRWTRKTKYGKIPYRYGTKRENKIFRNRSGIVYLESSFDMISIERGRCRGVFSLQKTRKPAVSRSRENENCFTNRKYVL